MRDGTQQIITRFEGMADSRELSVYLRNDGYAGLKKALTLAPTVVVDLVRQSGLRGRGGAGFPTGVKWGFVPADAKEVYLLCNNDEGEPGTFKDRYIMECSPHMIIEGMLIAAYAIGAQKGYIYTRYEFFEEIAWMEQAIREAYGAGFLGSGILGSHFSFELDHYTGAGAYICGEETGLISSLEGKKGQPKLKPPFPAVSGYLGKPTVVNNTETLAAVPWIVLNGADAYRQIGTRESCGTKLFCVSGPVVRPGVYEKPLGYPLDRLIYEDAGGMVPGKELKGVIPGGVSAPILTKDEIVGLPLDYESLSNAGSMLGSGAVVVIPSDQCMVELLHIVADFFQHESCGQCTPCREGTGWLAAMAGRFRQGLGSPADLDTMYAVADNMAGRTICALSDAAAMPTKAILMKFREEFSNDLPHEVQGG